MRKEIQPKQHIWICGEQGYAGYARRAVSQRHDEQYKYNNETRGDTNDRREQASTQGRIEFSRDYRARRIYVTSPAREVERQSFFVRAHLYGCNTVQLAILFPVTGHPGLRFLPRTECDPANCLCAPRWAQRGNRCSVPIVALVFAHSCKLQLYNNNDMSIPGPGGAPLFFLSLSHVRSHGPPSWPSKSIHEYQMEPDRRT